MALEIERKYLVRDSSWKEGAEGKHYCQGYLSRKKQATVRVRRIEDRGFITIKGASRGFTRDEYEYEIPVSDAENLLATLCEQPLVEKYRYRVEFAGMVWEVDEFLGNNSPLVVAEIELASEKQEFLRPGWLGEEVTGDKRYFNSFLCEKPYSSW